MSTPVMPLTRNVDPPQQLWIWFNGTHGYDGADHLLYPDEDPSIELRFAPENVLLVGTGIQLRVGARALGLRIPRRSRLSPHAPKGTEEIEGCSGQTMCAGGVMFCCDPVVVLRSCMGAWRCP